MLILCPNCSTSYQIEPGSLGAGRTVRCARCKTTWFATGSADAPEMAATVGATEDDMRIGVIRPHEPVPGTVDVSEVAQPDSATVPGDAAQDDLSATPGADASEPVTIAEAPSVVPPIEPPSSPDLVAKPDGDELENFSARRKRLQARRKKEQRSSHWIALIVALFAFNVALIAARSEVVRILPQTASLFSAIGLPVNIRNLKFENMRISKESQEGLSALVIEGTIVSLASKPTEVPRLRFAARDAMGQEVYTWTSMPSRSILPAGDKLDFRSRLVSPPESATDVVVRFSTPEDAAAAAK